MDNTNNTDPNNPIQPPSFGNPPPPPPLPQDSTPFQPATPLPSPVPDPVPAPAQPQDTTPTWTPPATEPNTAPAEPIPQPQAPQPTWIPPEPQPTIPTPQLSATQPSWTATPEIPQSQPTAESAPTDLSHLIPNNPPQETPVQPSTETLVVPPVNSSSEDSQYQNSPHKGFPRWLIGLGLGLLVLVAGASAYFILGIGQQKTTTTSLPAEVAPAKTEPINPPPIPEITSVPASGSANFGELEGSGRTEPQSTSAADLIRQRQGL